MNQTTFHASGACNCAFFHFAVVMTTCITAIFTLLGAKFSIKNEVDGFETVFYVLSGLKLNSFAISMDVLQALIVFSTHI